MNVNIRMYICKIGIIMKLVKGETLLLLQPIAISRLIAPENCHLGRHKNKRTWHGVFLIVNEDGLQLQEHTHKIIKMLSAIPY